MTASLDERVLATMTYAAVFSDGLSRPQLAQRLLGPGGADPAELDGALKRLNGGSGRLRTRGDRYALADVAAPAAAGSPDLEPVRAWARAAGRLPFVRFIGLTGSLAKGAAGDDADVLVVAARERAYLVFSMLRSLGRWRAARRGFRLCANLVVDETRLGLAPHDAFTATELVTMEPLYDEGVYARLWEANRSWVERWCGNARPAASVADEASPAKRVAERLFGGVAGRAVDRAAFVFKRRRLRRQLGAAALGGPAVVVGPGILKQHTVDHRADILERFASRLAGLGLDPAWAASDAVRRG